MIVFRALKLSLQMLNITGRDTVLKRVIIKMYSLNMNPIHAGLCGWCSTREGGVFHLHPVTPLSLKLDDSYFVQNYFGVRSIFCSKKNRGQVDNDVIMTSSLL